MDLVTLVVVLVATVVVATVMSKLPVPQSLRTKFANAGMLRGQTKEQIIAAVGQPNTFSAAPGGKTLLQWMSNTAAGAYHVALLFDANGVCEGVTHEHDSTR